jgi:hypothetical protein
MSIFIVLFSSWYQMSYSTRQRSPIDFAILGEIAEVMFEVSNMD